MRWEDAELKSDAMKLPLQVTFRHMDPSPAIEANIRERAARLDRFHGRITGCHVVVEAPHRRHAKGKLYTVRVDLVVPGGEIVVNRGAHDRHAHEDVFVAIRDAFSATQRRLKDHARRRRGEVKSHEAPPHGRIARLFPAQDYGFIAAADGREIYFHRNAVVGNAFDDLEVGDEVRFAEARGDEGPQASTVHPHGKKHIVG